MKPSVPLRSQDARLRVLVQCEAHWLDLSAKSEDDAGCASPSRRSGDEGGDYEPALQRGDGGQPMHRRRARGRAEPRKGARQERRAVVAAQPREYAAAPSELAEAAAARLTSVWQDRRQGCAFTARTVRGLLRCVLQPGTLADGTELEVERPNPNLRHGNVRRCCTAWRARRQFGQYTLLRRKNGLGDTKGEGGGRRGVTLAEGHRGRAARWRRCRARSSGATSSVPSSLNTTRATLCHLLIVGQRIGLRQ